MASSATASASAPEVAALCALFDALFLGPYGTRLCAGGDEPLYLPAGADEPLNRIVFRHDYAASALHEVAHWCIAGAERRCLPDYGYWYAPDGRDRDAQREFERVEARPQALEWLFSDACGLPFRPSIDNLSGSASDSAGFCAAIAAAARDYCQRGLPERARAFHAALAARFGGRARLLAADYPLARLWTPRT